MPTINVDTSTNIKDLAYVAGDTLNIRNTGKTGATLTIDAQVAADVTKIEGTKPLNIWVNALGVLELKNTSTTQPLIVALSGRNGAIYSTARTGIVKVRGALMSIGTGNGGANQQVDLNSYPSSNGATIDVPQAVWVEKTPGLEDWVVCLNIHGERKDASNVTYASGFKYLSQFGTTPEVGSVFEYDEYTKTIHFGHTDGWNVRVSVTAGTAITIGAQYDHNGSRFVVESVSYSGTAPRIYTLALRRISGTNPPTNSGTYVKFSGTGETTLTADTAAYEIAATGGWLPPNGSAIKIPNIHITCVGVPTSDSDRSQFDAGNVNYGHYDFEFCTWSNRFKQTGSPYYGGTYRFRAVAFIHRLARNAVRDLVDIDGLYAPLDRFGGTSGFSFTNCACPFTLKNMDTMLAGGAAASPTLASLANVVAIGDIKLRMVDRNVTYNTGITFDGVSGLPDAPLITGQISSLGNPLIIQNCSNFIIGSLRASDNNCKVPSQNNAVNMMRVLANKNVIIKDIAIINGGSHPRAGFTGSSSLANTNFAFHSANIDCGFVSLGMFASYLCGPRTWVTDWNFVNAPASQVVIPVSGGIGSRDVRFSGCRSDVASGTTMCLQGQFIDRCDGSIMDTTDVDFAMSVIYTNAEKTVGALILPVGTDQLVEENYTVSGGTFVKGVDYIFTGALLYIPTTGMTITWKNQKPLRGVTSMSAMTAPWHVSSNGYNQPDMPSGVSAQFRMKSSNSVSWGNWYAYQGATVTNFNTAFNAMSEYDSNIGFDFEFSITTTTTNNTRYLQGLTLRGLTTNPTFTYTEIGFIQVGLTGVEQDGAVAVFDNTTPLSPVLYDYSLSPVSEEIVFEYPYNFGETPTQIKLVARKAGFEEYVFEGQSWQAGKIVPASLALKETVIADSGGVTFDASTSATLIADKTFQQLFSNAQHRSCLEANMGYTVPVISGGNKAYTAKVDIIVTGWTLNGSGSLAMGAKLLTSNDLFSYTYTGGTFSQATTIPSFAGGTLTLPTTITTSPGFTMGSGEIVFDDVSADWDLSSCIIDSGVTLSNTSGTGITVKMPSGYPSTTIGSGTTEIIILAAVNTLTIAGSVTLAGAEVRLYDLDNNPSGSLGTELAGGTESAAGATVSFAVSSGNTVWIQIIKTGYVEFGQSYTMGGTTTFTAQLSADGNL